MPEAPGCTRRKSGLLLLDSPNAGFLPYPLMTDQEFGRLIDTVQQLPFVSYVRAEERGNLIVVGLVPPLAQYLPENRRAINFLRSDFTVANVVDGYESLILTYLNEGHTLTQQLLTRSEPGSAE